MCKRVLFILIIISSFFSCGGEDKNNTSSGKILNVDSDKGEIKNTNLDTTIQNNSATDIGLPPVKTNENPGASDKMKNLKMDIKIFRNTDISGYGYDIILDGKTYVHQPNIPAVPGNNGFSSEEKARKVAELVIFKIRNNIMPPTVEVKELDSLNAR